MEDFSDGGSGGGPNVTEIKRVDKYSPASTARVVKVYLRGSWNSGSHQEILCKMEDGKYIRISRTNGCDTFQYGASWQHLKQMPKLESARPPGKTVGDAVQAFEKIHEKWPNYEHADCQTFAHATYQELTGSLPEGVVDDDSSW